MSLMAGSQFFSTDSDPDSATVIWHTQSKAAARDNDLVASVTNEILQLSWCGAACDAFWMGRTQALACW